MLARLLIVILSVLLAVPSAQAAPAPAAPNDRVVVLISLDGLCGYYLDWDAPPTPDAPAGPEVTA